MTLLSQGGGIPPFSMYGQGDPYMNWRQILMDSGYDPDVSPFPGLMGPVFNAKAYGAVGDGVTDDSAAIQAALDAIPVQGGTLVLPQPASAYSIGATISLPVDRHIAILGFESHTTNQNGGTFGGAVLRRRSGQSGPLMQHDATTANFGPKIAGVTFDGGGHRNDLLYLKHIQQARLQRCVFFDTLGNGLNCEGVDNSYVIDPIFLECGDTGTPAYSFRLANSATRGNNTVFVVNPHFEVGRGTYFYCADTDGALPTALVYIIGGKCEFSGNLLSTTPAVPFVDLNNAATLAILGMLFANGQANGATHIKVSNSSRVTLETYHVTNTTTDNLNPSFFVDVVSGDGIDISGQYYRGGGGGGAQVRVAAGATNVTLNPRNRYDSPVGTGVPVKWGGTLTMERVGAGWTGLQSQLFSLGAGSTLEGPARGCLITRCSSGGSAIVLSAGNKGDVHLIVHQGTSVPIEFNATDATSRVYKATQATIFPGEVGIFVWDSSLALWCKVQARQRGVVAQAFAGSFTPLPLDGEIIEVGALTAAIAIQDVSANHKRKGMVVTFRFLQDGTGGRNVTWDAVWKQAWSDTGNTANKISMISFYYDGTNFIQLGAQSPYF